VKLKPEDRKRSSTDWKKLEIDLSEGQALSCLTESSSQLKDVRGEGVQ
jgi:hypothetical protein